MTSNFRSIRSVSGTKVWSHLATCHRYYLCDVTARDAVLRPDSPQWHVCTFLHINLWRSFIYSRRVQFYKNSLLGILNLYLAKTKQDGASETPNAFNFSRPDDFKSWKTRFNRYRLVTKLRKGDKEMYYTIQGALWCVVIDMLSIWPLLLLIMYFRHDVMFLSHNHHAKNILANEQIYSGNKTRQWIKSVHFIMHKCYHMIWI